MQVDRAPDVIVVAKIGSSSITQEAGFVDTRAVAKLCGEVAALRADGHRVVVVSSGAVAAGVAALGLEARPTDPVVLQAISAAGQSRLMRVYDDLLGDHGLVAAQVLLTPHDFVDRAQYLHARQTLHKLLELGCVPVINENDAIADDEIRFGDNDRIAALIANLLGASVLVLLTDTPGLYTADPRLHDDAQLIERVDDVEVLLAATVGGAGTARGSGGMASKLAAARMASWSGVRAVIAKASRPRVLADAVAGVRGVGTIFHPHERRLPARKLWIAFAVSPIGSITVDDGARRALVGFGGSLLPAGVLKVEGDYAEGDPVDICDSSGQVFARGLARVNSATSAKIAGRRTTELPLDFPHELVHRDDLVVLP